ncbi:MAG: deoxyuridine 5-triphosphate nucleotidohydrolase [Clostridia bacterium]|nr:deoxyuridine 5-triphosphate nucleotidohydrolase [Clostridia bacterium]
MDLKIKRIDRDGKKPPLPCYGSEGAAGIDLTAFINEEITIIPTEITLVPTGICVEIPIGYVGLLFVRSSLGVKHGITLSNSVGVIDSDYRGEIKIGLCNTSSLKYTIQQGDRIAQLVLIPYLKVNVNEVEELSSTERNQGGFGSTGR